MLNNDSIIYDTIPKEFYLSQNYPNPFKEKTMIKYCVPYKSWVRLNVYDQDEKLVEQLVNDIKEPGTFEVEFNALTSQSGKARNLSDGYYAYTMTAEEYFSEKKWLCINHLSGKFNMKSLLHLLGLPAPYNGTNA